MNNVYQVNWSVFVRIYIIIALRTASILAWLDAIFTAIADFHGRFLAQRTAWLYQQHHTAQVCHIEKVCNDAFDGSLRRIYVTLATFEEYLYAYSPGVDDHYLQEQNADPDNPIYLLEGGAQHVSPDAIIWVPIELKPGTESEQLQFEENIRTLVDYYKTYGPNYTIKYYE